MPEADLALLIDAAKAAGDIAKPFFQNDAKKWDKEDGTGPVTEADLAVNSYLEDTLRAARPDYGWLSEESKDTDERLSKDRVFIIDPIDGTRSFIHGAKTWAHSIAVAEAGDIIAAVILLPMLDLMFTAHLGGGAHLNGETISPSPHADMQTAQVLAAKPAMDAQHWKAAAAPTFNRDHRPSLAYRLSLVAQGRFDAMLTFRPSWEWDIAAGALIASEAGAMISDKTGAPLRFNSSDPRLNGVVAAGPNLHPELLSHLASA
ncbi:3'(2'),5'-bisphosphate nucleotidase CysQ [Planktotalea sp.]|uniref:3'(2'),5'-bisphosphate nucleotidase CysQ n=1 Tax=Planktotalea sp. TaxID=2029877 RepID=UPI0032972519